MKRVMVVDDQYAVRRTLGMVLSKQGYEVLEANSGEMALEQMEPSMPDLVVTDLWMDGMSGVELVRELKHRHPAVEVIVLTAYGSVESAVDAMKAGAFDYLTKPVKNAELVLKAKRALERSQMASEIDRLRRDADWNQSADHLVAESPAMRSIMKSIQQVSGTNLTLLITGETGTGKSAVARMIHHNSRSDHRFMSVNCAALPEPLLESELFGHVKGAFTGASQARKGLFEEADRGTLFLDEIGMLPANMQAKLLGALQDREIRRVGSNEPIRVDVRVIGATNLDLEQAVASNEFREDLFYRLNVARIRMPPLRERREDIPRLVSRFLALHAEREERDYQIQAEALEALVRHDYPGNVRELENAMEWAMAVCREGVITAADLPEVFRQAPSVAPARETAATLSPGDDSGLSLSQHEQRTIVDAIQRCEGNLSAAARALGIGRTTLWRKMREYGISRSDEIDRESVE